MKWIAGVPETMGWYLVWTLNETYDHLPRMWCKAWFDGEAWTEDGDIAHYHRVTHWMRVVEPGVAETA